MHAQRLSCENLLADQSMLRELSRRIGSGAAFVYPTETIYGIGAHALIPGTEATIVAAKKRKPDHPFLCVASDINHFDRLHLHMSNTARCLADAFWPGSLTLVVPGGVHGRLTGVRVSPHPFVKALGLMMPAPLFSTSANISGEPYAPEPQVIYDTFKESVGFMVDAGTLPPGEPSTVVKVVEKSVTIIREGAIPATRIEQITGRCRTGE